LVLSTLPDMADRIGTYTGHVSACNDPAAPHHSLLAAGGRVRGRAREQPGGLWATVEDPDGNTFGLVQRSGEGITSS
jgi:predicted enzyme related to lactoylglutathione lyase